MRHFRNTGFCLVNPSVSSHLGDHQGSDRKWRNLKLGSIFEILLYIFIAAFENNFFFFTCTRAPAWQSLHWRRAKDSLWVLSTRFSLFRKVHKARKNCLIWSERRCGTVMPRPHLGRECTFGAMWCQHYILSSPCKKEGEERSHPCLHMRKSTPPLPFEWEGKPELEFKWVCQMCVLINVNYNSRNGHLRLPLSL